MIAAVFAVILVAGGLVYRSHRSTRSRNGPLGNPTNVLVDCYTVPLTGRATFGAVVLQNTARSPVEIESVNLFQPNRVRLVADPTLVEQGGLTSIGNSPRYPPTVPASDAAGWARRRNAVGATIPAAGSGRPGVYDVVLGVTRRSPASDGSFTGVVVDYRVGGHAYALLTKWGMILYRSSCDAPTAPTDVPYP